MICDIYKIYIRRILAGVLAFMLAIPTAGVRAQAVGLPPAGERVGLSTSFHPPILVGLKANDHDPLKFSFILDKGDSRDGVNELQAESTRLIKYFLASLTIPEKDLWVNLSPYEKDRIVPDAFGQTEMGRDTLTQDYMLKQITASLIYPEGEIGREFWKRVYREAQEQFGTIDIPIDTFNKVWIVPEKAVVYENKGAVYITETHLKVMLEEDYVAARHSEAEDPSGPLAGYQLDGNLHNSKSMSSELAKDVLRDIVVPVLEKEVNEGKNFAQIRQVYHSLILAIWYKDRVKESIFGKAYVDQNKTGGVDIRDKAEKEKIWQQYVLAFQKGAFNFIKEELDPGSHEAIPRKYFSGGLKLGETREAMDRNGKPEDVPTGVSENRLVLDAGALPDDGENKPGSGEITDGDKVEEPVKNDGGAVGNDFVIPDKPAEDAQPLEDIPKLEILSDYRKPLRIGEVEIQKQLAWETKAASNEFTTPQFFLQLKKLDDADFDYKPYEPVPFGFFSAMIADIDGWGDRKTPEDRNYKGQVLLSFDENGYLVKPSGSWELVQPLEPAPHFRQWQIDFVFKQLDELVGKPFAVQSLADVPGFKKHGAVPAAIRNMSQEAAIQTGSMAHFSYTFYWKNFSGNIFKGDQQQKASDGEPLDTEAKRKDKLIHRVTEFIADRDVYSSNLKNLGYDLPYEDLGHVDIQYIRASQRVVLLVTLHPRLGAPSHLKSVSFIIKRGVDDHKNRMASKWLSPKGFVPRFGESRDHLYSEAVVAGKSAAAIMAKRGLEYDEIFNIAATWMEVTRALKRLNVREPFVVDMNPGNIMKEDAQERKSPRGYVVVDIYGSESSPANRAIYLVREFYKHYLSGRNNQHLPATPDSLQAMMAGLLDAFGSDKENIDKFFGDLIHASVKELPQEVMRMAKVIVEENKKDPLQEADNEEQQDPDLGGIDLTQGHVGLEVNRQAGGIEFIFSPEMIRRLERSSGLVPVITAMRPMTGSVLEFLHSGVHRN